MGNENKQRRNSNFFFPNLDMGPWNSTSGESPTFDKVRE